VLALHEALGLPDYVPRATVVLLVLGLPVVMATAYVQQRLPKTSELLGRMDFDPTLHPNLEGVVRARQPGAAARLLTWRRSVIAGVAAFMLLATGTTGFVAVQRHGTLFAQGLVDSERPVVLADFANTSHDATLGSVVTEALRVDLQQSNVVRLAQASDIEAALRRMQRSPANGLPTDVARELAVREGLRAIITGQVSSLGAGYVITSTVISADSARTLASFRTEARDSTELISAVNKLSKEMREKIGESVRRVRSAMPLEKATTASLPALRKYTKGIVIERETGDNLRAIALMREAVAIDSTFGDAWGKIGTILGNLGIRPKDRDLALTRAYELRDRLPETDRYITTALYMEIVREDNEGAIAAYRQVLAGDSSNYPALNNLGILLMDGRRYPEAEAMLVRATHLRSTEPSAWINLIIVQYAQGKSADAVRTLAAARAALPNNFDIRALELNAAVNDGHWERVDSMARQVAAAYPENTGAQLAMLSSRVNAAQVQGRFEQARALATQLRDRYNAMHFPGMALLTSINLADLRYFAGDMTGAIRELDAGIREHPMASFPPGIGPTPSAILAYSRYGLHDRARAMLDARRTEDGKPDEPDRYVRAVLDANRGNAAAALPIIRVRIDSIFCAVCRLVELGRAYEAAGQPDSARAVFERYLTTPAFGRINFESAWRPYVLVHVAGLHETAGDTARALARYAEFVRLWSGADPALQPRVEAARRRIVALKGRD
jgi:eukaryotic-like serine/threonine-protein kinase